MQELPLKTKQTPPHMFTHEKQALKTATRFGRLRNPVGSEARLRPGSPSQFHPIYKPAFRACDYKPGQNKYIQQRDQSHQLVPPGPKPPEDSGGRLPWGKKGRV